MDKQSVSTWDIFNHWSASNVRMQAVFSWDILNHWSASNVRMQAVFSWDILNHWSVSNLTYSSYNTLHDWNDLNSFIGSAAKVFKTYKSNLLRMLKSSDERLNYLNGDPLHHNWLTFRPLRLSREEDWSNWLAFLIQSSCGSFNRALLEREEFPIEDYEKPEVDREVSNEGYRSDIIIRWVNGCADHIEVKVGDPSLNKTYGTSIAMRHRYGSSVKQWFDWILLLDSQVPDWELVSQVEQQNYSDVNIKSITWNDVSVAIRKCLYGKSESITWLSWAYAFTGAIETRLCNIITPSDSSEKLEGFNFSEGVLFLSEILKRSLEYERC